LKAGQSHRRPSRPLEPIIAEQRQARQEQPSEARFVAASVLLEHLDSVAPKDEVTVRWVLNHLDRQSFGVVLLLLAIVAVVPGISSFAGLLIAISGFEMALGRSVPYFPRWIASRPLRARRVRPVVTCAIAVLRFLEKVVHPRWRPLTSKLTRVVGITVFLASVRLILVPLPFSNVLPALVIAVVSLAYLEEDGLLLAIALALAAGNVALDSALAWESIVRLHGIQLR
jgi:hypothetical protein